MRALIVDDSLFLREYLQQMLERMDVRCVQAASGREALEVLSGAETFDLMFCDVNMPEMGGMECVKALRQMERHEPMRVMMVTTEMDHRLIERALSYGADEFLMKPFTQEVLREKMLLMGVG